MIDFEPTDRDDYDAREDARMDHLQELADVRADETPGARRSSGYRLRPLAEISCAVCRFWTVRDDLLEPAPVAGEPLRHVCRDRAACDARARQAGRLESSCLMCGHTTADLEWFTFDAAGHALCRDRGDCLDRADSNDADSYNDDRRP